VQGKPAVIFYTNLVKLKYSAAASHNCARWSFGIYL